MPGPETFRMEKSNANFASNGLSYHVSEEPLRKKKKDKSRKSIDAVCEAELRHQSNEPRKKKKDKDRKKVKVGGDSPDSSLQVDAIAGKDKSRKRKSSESLAAERESKLGKVGQFDSAESEQRTEVANPYAVRNFRISDVLIKKLKSKGIEALFPIQALTFDKIYEGKDLVGRARTGQGKTLAFVLPILESLAVSEAFRAQRQSFGRAPSVLVLAPTRELAKQVHADFELYGGAIGLSTVCIYGGAPYGPQQNALRKGVDVVVGTPGRIKDHLEGGTLKLKTVKFRVLDEADEMLNMGFVDDVETILGHVEDASAVQTLLFSATMPNWVKQIASRFLKETKQTVDLVGDDKMKASSSVKHLLLPCMRSARSHLIPDVISCYSSGGRTIIFTETKNDASELAALIPGTARALHGDIAQGQREATLAGFRSGKFLVLVATDVAARGLDITDVQLIIQCEPPRDVESYIHRSGRTGRAGKTGISVLLNDRRKDYMIGNIEQKAGFRFERISAPQPADIARAASASAQERVLDVSESVLRIFRPAADELLQASGLSPADLLAKALARIAGHTDMKKRSLLTSQHDFVTLILQTGNPIYTPTFAFNCLRRVLPEDTLGEVRGMSITTGGVGAVFDVPHQSVDNFLSAQGTDQSKLDARDSFSITVLESLPDLQTRPKGSNFGNSGQGENGSGGPRRRHGRGGHFGNRGMSNREGHNKRNGFERGPQRGRQGRKMLHK